MRDVGRHAQAADRGPACDVVHHERRLSAQAGLEDSHDFRRPELIAPALPVRHGLSSQPLLRSEIYATDKYRYTQRNSDQHREGDRWPETGARYCPCQSVFVGYLWLDLRGGGGLVPQRLFDGLVVPVADQREHPAPFVFQRGAQIAGIARADYPDARQRRPPCGPAPRSRARDRLLPRRSAARRRTRRA